MLYYFFPKLRPERLDGRTLEVGEVLELKKSYELYGVLEVPAGAKLVLDGAKIEFCGESQILRSGGEIIIKNTNLTQLDIEGNFGSFTDPRDGQVYKTVRIGNQIWMAENLNYKIDEGTGSWCYDNNPINGKKFGRLYNWETALKSAPEGWHVPTDEEWSELELFLGEKDAGTKLKSKTGWSSGNGTDDFGFSALPAGYRYFDGSFDYLGFYAFFWSASLSGQGGAWRRYLYGGNAGVDRNGGGKDDGFSVRCVMDI